MKFSAKWKWHWVVIALLTGFGLGLLAGKTFMKPSFGPPHSETEKQRMFERFSKKIGLTEEQKPLVKAVFEAKKPGMKALHDEMRAKMDAMREETHAEIKRFLTPEQQRRLEEHHAAMKKRFERRGPGAPPGED